MFIRRVVQVAHAGSTGADERFECAAALVEAVFFRGLLLSCVRVCEDKLLGRDREACYAGDVVATRNAEEFIRWGMPSRAP